MNNILKPIFSYKIHEYIKIYQKILNFENSEMILLYSLFIQSVFIIISPLQIPDLIHIYFYI